MSLTGQYIGPLRNVPSKHRLVMEVPQLENCLRNSHPQNPLLETVIGPSRLITSVGPRLSICKSMKHFNVGSLLIRGLIAMHILGGIMCGRRRWSTFVVF